MVSQLSINSNVSEIVQFLQANLRPEERSIVPKELVLLIPHSDSYEQNKIDLTGQFAWIILDQSDLKEVDQAFHANLFDLFTPVLKNEEFLVFRRSAQLIVSPDKRDLEAKNQTFLSSKFRRGKTPLTLADIEAGIFVDQFWHGTLKFIAQYYRPGDKILAPDRFCNLFSDSYSYPHSYSKSTDFFDWILVHKGKISELDLKFLTHLCRTDTPAFANEVFVVFSPSQSLQRAEFHSDHFRSLHIQLLQLKTHRLVDKVISLNKTLKQRGNQDSREALPPAVGCESPLLIERKFVPKGWFSYEQGPPFIPLSWAATSEQQPFANLGDALSPVIISALSGLPTQHRDFESHERRLAAVGTIAHGLKNGMVHLWGTGTDVRKSEASHEASTRSTTQFHVHAVRGQKTARILQQKGIHVPDVYGDPVWFLPSIIPPAPTKQYELGIIVHLSELTEVTDKGKINPDFLRYHIPPSLSSSIQIITTMTRSTFAALEKRTQEITACRRIISTSLHGLVIAEAYGIPCAYFWNKGEGVEFANLNDESQRIDWRMRDFYSGIGVEKRFMYGQRRIKPTDWEAVIQAIDTHWSPIDWSPEAFLESFPLPLAFNPLQEKRFQNRSLLKQLKF